MKSVLMAAIMIIDNTLFLAAWAACFILFILAGILTMTGGPVFIHGIILTIFTIGLMIYMAIITDRHMG